MNVLWALLAGVAGIGFAMQGPVNAGLARHVGGPVAASLVSFLVGTASMLVFFVVAAALGKTQLRGALGAPAVNLVGGLLGAVGVMAMTLVVPRLGAAAAITAMLAGQLVCALVIDRFGLFGLTPLELAPRRLVGAVLMALAVWLMRR